VRKRPLLRQNSPGRVSSRGVPAARAYLENLLASPLPPPRPPCIATTKGGAGRGDDAGADIADRVGWTAWLGPISPFKGASTTASAGEARPDKGCRRSRPATTRLAPWRRRRGFIFAVHAQRQSSALPKSFERGNIRLVRLSPVSANRPFSEKR
jgi:hypothetical protein